jgi:ferric-dicitrate binding protein FerR (iron transport regulator)
MENFRTTLMNNVRRLLALSLAMAVLNLSTTLAFASPPKPLVALGSLQVSGIVTVNDLRAVSGDTILSGSHIVTSSKSNSILDLRNLTRLIMSEQTELALDFSAPSISGSLRRGELRSFIPVARTASIATPDGVIATDSSQPAVFSVQVEAGSTRVSVETGRIELRSGSNSRVLRAGETFSTACDSWGVPIPQQSLSKNEKLGILAGVGAGIALLLVAITVGKREEPPDFGGCVIILSPGAGNGTCH